MIHRKAILLMALICKLLFSSQLLAEDGQTTFQADNVVLLEDGLLRAEGNVTIKEDYCLLMLML